MRREQNDGRRRPELPSVVHLKRLAVDHRMNISLAVDTVGTTMRKKAEVLNVALKAKARLPLRSTSVTMSFSPGKPLLDVLRRQIRASHTTAGSGPHAPKMRGSEF